MRVNLLPERLQQPSFSMKRVLVLVVPLLILTLLLFSYIFVNNHLTVLKQELILLERQHEPLNRMINQVRALERELQDMKNYISYLETLGQHFNWADLLIEVGYLAPEGVQITNFQSSSKKEVLILGKAKDFELITSFINSLNRSIYFSHNELKTTGLARQEDAVEFRIEGRLVMEDKL